MEEEEAGQGESQGIKKSYLRGDVSGRNRRVPAPSCCSAAAPSGTPAHCLLSLAREASAGRTARCFWSFNKARARAGRLHAGTPDLCCGPALPAPLAGGEAALRQAAGTDSSVLQMSSGVCSESREMR